MILIAYDGSSDAKAAIARAGELMNGQAATVLTVWEPFVDVMTRTGAGLSLMPDMVDFAQLDDASERSARERAQEGVGVANDAGLKAQPRIRVRHATIADTIMAEADEVGAQSIVMGTRGLTGVKSFLLGSVSHAVLQRADRPVVVVPSPDLAKERASHRR